MIDRDLGTDGCRFRDLGVGEAVSCGSRPVADHRLACRCRAVGGDRVVEQRDRESREAGIPAAHAHLVHLNPFPPNLGEVLARYERILVPEMNLGQLTKLVRADFLVDAKTLPKVQGLPFRAAEIAAAIEEMSK